MMYSFIRSLAFSSSRQIACIFSKLDTCNKKATLAHPSNIFCYFDFLRHKSLNDDQRIMAQPLLCYINIDFFFFTVTVKQGQLCISL